MPNKSEGLNVLLVGGGAREDAIAWKLRQSDRVGNFFTAPGNAGTERWGTNLDIPANNIPLLNQAVEQNTIDIVIVGPEEPLFQGLADRLRETGTLVYGHSRAASEIERSKKFGMELAARAGVPHAYSEFAHSAVEAHRLIKEWNRVGGIVVKADGPALGKGVIVTDLKDEAHEAVEDIMIREKFGESGRLVVLQEKLVGPELSVQAAIEGKNVRMFPYSRDEKRVNDGRRGPNTGGMGAKTIELTEEQKRYIEVAIVQPIANMMVDMGYPFCGTLYPGLVLTPEGPRVIEFNCRFGDPETQVILPRVDEDLLEVLLDTAQGNLKSGRVKENREAVVNTVIVSKGYPLKYETGFEVNKEILEGEKEVTLFHAGTKRLQNGSVVTTGGRVFSVMTQGRTTREAAEKGQEWIRNTNFGFPEHYRTDIGLLD